MSTPHFVIEAAVDRILDAAGSVGAAFDLQDQIEKAVQRGIESAALPLDIPGASAFAVPLSGERCVIFSLRVIEDGLEVIVCDVADCPAERHPQLTRFVRRC
jgi:hypothetical protein